MAKRFYATTPIYYINDVPHLGTAYSTIAVDVLARYHRVRGELTHFLTGTDEHGLKIERAAKERNLSPEEFAANASAPFSAAWPRLHCAPDDFIRTTQPRHEHEAQGLWRRVRDRGDLYLGAYEGWYCVGCEAYFTEKELGPGNICPTHGTPVERVREPSYFFRLKKYQERLLAFYEKYPTFVAPPSRMNEVASFVRSGLEDLSVSRTTFRWGIPVPDDTGHVMYVWFDALANYWSAVQQPEELRQFWPPNLHVVGKDILRFHAVYWPAFLMAAGLADDELPRQIFAHGFLTFDGQKMSKSLRNTVKPVELAEAFGVDCVRYYLMRAIAFGQDGDFNIADLVQRYNSELGNSLGNLLNRVLPQCHRLTQSAVPELGALTALEEGLLAEAKKSAELARIAFDSVAPNRALDAIFALLAAANQYIDHAAPWAEAKKGDSARVATILGTSLMVLDAASLMIWPVMPDAADRIRKQLGLGPVAPVVGQDLWPNELSVRAAGQPLGQPEPLFPRIDKDREAQLVAELGLGTPAAPAGEPTAAQPAAPKDKPTQAASAQQAGQIVYDDFAKIDLRVAVILTAERIKGKDKLLSLMIDIGEPEPRPLVAGIALAYAPEELIGKRIVVVANLAPRSFGKGLVSHGMLLAAKTGDMLRLANVPGDMPAGAKIS